MELLDENNGLDDQLYNISICHKAFYDSLRILKGEIVNKSLIEKSKEYLENLDKRAQKLKKAYGTFSKQIEVYCDYYVNEVNAIEEEDISDIQELKDDFEKMKNEMEKKNEKMKEGSVFEVKELSFLYGGNVRSKMNAELVMKYPGSYLYKEYMNDKRTTDGDVFIDCDGKNDELIVKYMKEDEGLIDDLKKMNLVTKEKFLDDLSFLKLPIKKDFVNELGCNEDNEIMEAWKNRRVVMVNNEYNEEFIELLQKNQLLDTVFKNQNLGNIQYIKPQKSFTLAITLKYYDVIVDYLRNGEMINKELIAANSDHGNAEKLMNEMTMIGIELNNDKKKKIRECFYQPLFVKVSNIIDNSKEYDNCLQEWTGDCKWKLIYRASEHGYTAKSFHEYCDDKGPTLIVIKSSGGWIFGGYTTQSWSGNSIYYDDLCIDNQ